MTRIGLISVAAVLAFAATHSVRTTTAFSQADSSSRTGPSPVLVELFTSEGCSTCPPADQLLAKLQAEQPIAGVQVIGLEEHVDYWNHDGWSDPYSGTEWTARQQEYVARLKGNTPYTPEMIVDGQSAFVGNNARDATNAIRQAAQQERVRVSVTPASGSGDSQRFDVRVGNLPSSGGTEKADVWLAVTEEGLQTSVRAGENSGKSWEHGSIVRLLQKIGTTASDSPAPFAANPQVKLKSNWKREHLRMVVFVQERKTWHILGAASTKLTG